MKRTIGATLVTLSLVACGGGGGEDSAGDGGSNPVVDVVPSAGTLQTSVGAHSYPAHSTQADAYETLSAARVAAGTGPLAQSAAVDVAAQKHAAYLTAYLASTSDWHTEDPTKTDLFYATAPADRIAKAGFAAGYATEVIGGAGHEGGRGCSLGLLNTVYHAIAMLSEATHVGVGVGADAVDIPLCVMDLATASTNTYGQVPAAGELVAYPYNGQTGVYEVTYIGNEIPRPPMSVVPGLNTGTTVIAGFRNADFVNLGHAGTLNATVTKFELKDGSGNLVPAGVLVNASVKSVAAGPVLTADPNMPTGFAVLVPQAALLRGTTYTASFAATLGGGKSVAKTWSFTTNL